MNNNTLQIKFKQRLNKIDSQDYDNIQSWEIAEAFNKAQLEWCRRQLAGTNIRKEGDEMSKRRIDDLSLLLKKVPLEGKDVAYDGTFGYFDSTNFANIYNPETGGDYLEFKRIECAGQQCFPAVPQQTVGTGVMIENTATTDGYWIPNWNVNQAPYMFDIPIFTFSTYGNVSYTITNPDINTIANWGSYGDVSDVTPSIDSTLVTTQEPWLHNNSVSPIRWFASGEGSNANDMYNTNLITPYQDGTGVLSSCNTCGKNASDILSDANLLSSMCNNSPTGYLVGGPNNEYIDCTSVPATSSTIPNLIGSGTDINLSTYNYTGSSNTWVNIVPDIWGEGVVESCESSGCWYIPSSVSVETFSANNFQTFSNAWSDINLEGEIADSIEDGDTYVEGTSTTFYTEQITTTPFESCYCAPGADKENFCTKPRTMTVYQSEVANVDVILRDPLKRPDFEWAETFCTLQAYDSNYGASSAGLRIWRRNFYIMDPILVYYRVPRRIQILGSVDPYTGLTVTTDVPCEFKDDIVEILIDTAVSTLAGDISDANQMMRGEQAAEKNN